MARTREEKHKEQIANLLERAEDSSNSEEERESAARMAEKLAAKYSIDYAAARLHTRQKGERGDQIVTRSVTMPFKSGNTRDQGWVALMVELVTANDIYVVWQNNEMAVYGTKFDAEFTVSLFNILVHDQEEKALQYAKQRKDLKPQQAKDSFRYGYRTRVGERIARLREERASEIDKQNNLRQGSTAIAIRDRNAEIISQFNETMERENLQVKEDPFRVKNVDRDAYSSGDTAGATVKLFADQQIARGKRSVEK